MTRINYDAGWTNWNDMIDLSPAPYHRRRIIRDLAQEIEFKNVVDVGCGNGALLDLFRQSFRADLTGVDVSNFVISENTKGKQECRFRQLDISQSALDEKFDLVICSEVLEHIEDHDSAMDNLRKMCLKYLIVTVPRDPMFPLDRQFGHVRHYTEETLGVLLESHGILPVLTCSWGFPFHTIYKHLINLNPGTSMRRFAQREYGALEKLASTFLRALFYFNLSKGGLQIVCLGKVRR